MVRKVKVKILSGLFQGYPHLPFLFLEQWCQSVTCLVNALEATNSLNHKKRLINWCSWTTSSCLQKVEKNWRLIQTIIFSWDIGMEFGIKKCTMLPMRSRKRQIMEGIELLNQERIRMLWEKESCQNLAILEWKTKRRKKNYKKSTLDERENFSGPNSVAEIWSER